MKKIILTALVLVGLSFTSQAQEISENALGLRLGDNHGFGYELSYQRKLSSDNRLELDLGLRNSNEVNGFKITGVYQWVWNIEGGFNWYAGIGGGLGTWSYKNDYFNGSNETYAFVAGDLGIEYNFDFPLQIALDLRPELAFSDYNDGINSDIALSLRYKF
jgi:hypothetical protein